MSPYLFHAIRRDLTLDRNEWGQSKDHVIGVRREKSYQFFEPGEKTRQALFATFFNK